MKPKTITLADLIRRGKNLGASGYYKLSEQDIDMACKRFKDFLMSKCREGKRKDQMRYRSLSALKTTRYIFNRLVLDMQTGHVEFIAHQDYPSEMETLKREILKN